MTRACETCEWWAGAPVVSTAAHNGHRACKESAIEVLKAPSDWCGRWRPAERLAGGVDRRPVR